jgi:pimeloyl-ACP methyl ester carboxylesterase
VSPSAPGAGIELEYLEDGEGPPVVWVHGIASGPQEGLELARELGTPARTVAYSRRGYDGSGTPEPYLATTAAEQGEDLGALLAATGATGAVAAGSDFGALVILDRLIRAPGELAGAVIADPPLFALVPEASEALAAEREQLEGALAAGGPAAAAALLAGDGADDAARERAGANAAGCLADWSALASLPVTRGELRAIGVPVTVVTGPQSPPHVVAAADALAAEIPACGRRTDGDLAAALRPLVG